MKKIFNRKSKFVKIMEEDSKWIFPIIAAIPVCITAFMKFVEYVHAFVYTNYYGFDMSFYNFPSKPYIYSLFLSILSMIPIFITLYAVYEMRDILHTKSKPKDWKRFWGYFIGTLVVNGIISCFSIKLSNLLLFLSMIAFMYAYEYIFAIMISKAKKDTNVNIKKDAISFLICVFALIAVLIGQNFLEEMIRKDYRVVDNNKVVIYTDVDYYLTLDCEISNDNKLIIYKGTQSKIDNLDVSTELHKFDSVEVINKK